MSDQLPPLATPAEVAEYLHTTTAALAQDRYKGTGPKFVKLGAVGCSTGGLMSWNAWNATHGRIRTCGGTQQNFLRFSAIIALKTHQRFSCAANTAWRDKRPDSLVRIE